jgi:hypothetical protein
VSCRLDCCKTLPAIATIIASRDHWGLFYNFNEDSRSVFCKVSCYFNCGYLPPLKSRTFQLCCWFLHHPSLFFLNCLGMPISLAFVCRRSSFLQDSNFIGYNGVLNIFSIMQMFVLGPRLILNIRGYHAKLVAESDLRTRMAPIDFQELSTGGHV